MGRNSKWIDVQPGDSAEQVARRALRGRLERMWHYLGRAAQESQAETENVHQLRVFARRASATLEIFSSWLPKRRGKWMRKQVTRVRRAAGDARDFDVLLMRWQKEAHRLPAAQKEVLLAQLKERRRAAQHPIEEVQEKLSQKDFVRKTEKFVRHVREREQDDVCAGRFECLARVALGRLVAPYLAAGQTELNDVESLHAFRIQGKQVRYAMEIFAGAFDDEFRRELYPLVVTLQERLGAINDHVTAHAYFARWQSETTCDEVREALDAATLCEQQALETMQREFPAWWTHERKDDLRARFARYVHLTDADGSASEQVGPADDDLPNAAQ